MWCLRRRRSEAWLPTRARRATRRDREGRASLYATRTTLRLASGAPSPAPAIVRRRSSLVNLCEK